jgi:phosphoribosylformylglycinamidine cyclo-ligase
MDYKESGVDIAAGEAAVRDIKQIVRRTYNRNVLSDLGSFGGLYSLDLSSWREPVLVSSTDGVGTKLIIAQMMGVYDTVGADLVNHCVNDIFVQGAIPQFFNDYIGVAKLDSTKISKIIEGMSTACIENEMSLIGGEMAEMPDIYHGDDFDLVGTIVGLVEKKDIITGDKIREGDVVIGFPSTGLHTNGYSLARKIVFDLKGLSIDTYIDELGETIGEALLRVHRSYLPTLKKWAKPELINGMAHITGGGLNGNIKRIIPNGLNVNIDREAWDVPSVFRWLCKNGDVPIDDAYSAWNMGIGFVVITGKKNAEMIISESDGFVIGSVFCL